MKKLFITFVIGVILTACSTEKAHKTENKMEPRILAIGRLQSTLDVLVEEWERYGRNVIVSNSKDIYRSIDYAQECSIKVVSQLGVVTV